MVRRWREVYNQEIAARYSMLVQKHGEGFIYHLEEARAAADAIALKAVEGMLDGQ